ncbi:hypothetical protein [Streptomyces gardneri]|uniref:WW domain-containing protein n=1 Tax=Streptomyces gardneri TaxID=66892 RepID=A0A4Y3RXI1_9ACTN|nr:hypothetical protein [Streptomyces gardneri]GEB60600.1 hypothetical protein SGA01_62050 [Streptomyces gardneri]GHH07884.1 hypothetical protein GCM10017674_49800 [Streptomyces gardneri]
MKKKYLSAVVAVAAAATLAAPASATAETKPTETFAATAATATVQAAETRTTPSKATVPNTPIRTVRPGERVDAGQGWTVWLTKQGKYWSGPDGYENFRSVVDGNIDRTRPGVSHQSEGGESGVFHSGLYYGTRAAGRVELTDADGRKTLATLVALPGRSDWGVWYVHTAPTQGGSPAVALYDRSGKLLADLPAWDF